MFIKLLKKIYPKPRRINSIGKLSIIKFPRIFNGGRFIDIGEDVVIQSNSWIAAYQEYEGGYFSPSIKIGNHVKIGRHSFITAINHISIGSGCLFSEQVFVSDHYHRTDIDGMSPHKQPLKSKGPVIIGDNCFIGIRACILSGVTLGDNCVVGANSVVTRSFPSGSVLGGSPARLIKRTK